MEPSEEIRTILSDLLDHTMEQFDRIHAIAARESDQAGEDTPIGQAWYAFGSDTLISDTGMAFRTIQLAIASVRGMLVYRTLDPTAQMMPNPSAPPPAAPQSNP